MELQVFIVLQSFLRLFAMGSAQTFDLSAPTRPPPQEYYRICPLPKCETCPSVEELRAPGIGFALETSHGAAVVRLHDGTFHHITLIEGDASYVALMLKLATGPMIRTPDHLDTYWEKLQYLRSRVQRLLNKLVGRPATPETAILASMVSKLLEATRLWLGDKQTVLAAVLSSPNRIRLDQEEIGDIFDYLKIDNLMAWPRSLYELYAASAAYAGYGKGLCHNYTDAYACEREEFEFLPQRLLHLDFNPESLSGTILSINSVHDGSVDVQFVDPDLGLGREVVRGASSTGGGGGDEQYWTAVSDRIRSFVQSLNRFYMPQPTEVVLTGPSATNSRFQAAIRAALHDNVADEFVLALLENHSEASNEQEEWQSLFSFATARGAAEMAKRNQEGPVYCDQSDECRKRRERVHGEQLSMFLNQRPGVKRLRR